MLDIDKIGGSLIFMGEQPGLILLTDEYGNDEEEELYSNLAKEMKGEILFAISNRLDKNMNFKTLASIL